MRPISCPTTMTSSRRISVACCRSISASRSVSSCVKLCAICESCPVAIYRVLIVHVVRTAVSICSAERRSSEGVAASHRFVQGVDRTAHAIVSDHSGTYQRVTHRFDSSVDRHLMSTIVELDQFDAKRAQEIIIGVIPLLTKFLSTPIPQQQTNNQMNPALLRQATHEFMTLQVKVRSDSAAGLLRTTHG